MYTLFQHTTIISRQIVEFHYLYLIIISYPLEQWASVPKQFDSFAY